MSRSKVIQPKEDGKKAAGRHRATASNTTQVAKARHSGNPLWPEIGQESAHSSETPVRTEEGKDEFEDDDDDLMVVAVYEAEKTLQFDQCEPAGAENTAFSCSPSSRQSYPDFPGFESSSAKVWIYPTNYPIREYQLKMSQAALFQNTMVCLPTGLGKTFIASVVMYNFYRWYPSGKIVFMAPTKPLVAQQIEACFKVMGIPQAHMAELTGIKIMTQKKKSCHSTFLFWLFLTIIHL